LILNHMVKYLVPDADCQVRYAMGGRWPSSGEG
jgi:hypothetical protein